MHFFACLGHAEPMVFHGIDSLEFMLAATLVDSTFLKRVLKQVVSGLPVGNSLVDGVCSQSVR